MKIIIRGKKYKWTCPEWLKFIGAALIIVPIELIPFALYAAAVVI